MDEILDRLSEMEWVYGDGDPVALAELRNRIDAIGPNPNGFLKYTDFVDGVTFRLANVNNGEPFEIREWTNLERAIIGSFLGRITADSYRQGRFFASALVIRSEGTGPGDGFYSLAHDVGAIRSRNEDLEFWLRHVNLARQWYAANRVGEQ